MLTPPPDRYADQLLRQAEGPHDDAVTVDVAKVAALAVRFLRNAVTRGGLTGPATACAIAGELASVAWDLRQTLIKTNQWLEAEIRAGRITDVGKRRTSELEDGLRSRTAEARELGEDLAGALSAFQSLTSTLITSRGDER